MEKSNVIFGEGNGGLPKIAVHTEWSNAEVYLQGAHVTHFQHKGELPLLFLSNKSKFQNGQPIRGGVPIIFPWFGAREGKQMHGFARNQAWELKEILSTDDVVTLRLSLPESPESIGFPKFKAEYFVTVGQSLNLELKITNISEQDFSFDNCLHTYFAIGDIHAVSVMGLKGGEYLDKVEGFARKTESAPEIKFARETDRVYLNTTSAVEIHDAEVQRKIIVEKEGSNSTVIWNPWIDKSKAMVDFGDDEYLRMVCVESGNVSENNVILAAGKTFSLKVRLATSKL